MNRNYSVNFNLLLRRRVFYGLLTGVGTAALVLLAATVMDFSLGPTAAVLFFGAILALVLLLGTPGMGPGPATGEMQSQAEGF